MPSAGLIRELPVSERPRERLLKQGSAALSDAELVAVLLRTGTKGISALQMATELIQETGGLSGLVSLTPNLLRRNGLGPAKAAALLAALEIAGRIAREQINEREPLTRPAEVARYLHLRFWARDQEVVGALFLDSRNRLLGDRELFRGTLDRAVADPREILKEALLRGAAAVILFHTHPSGDPSPSEPDILFTRRLKEAAEVVGLRLADHMILGDAGRWVSLRQRGAC
ncbi:MAG TPA: DNA repair protein RadC [Thermoanaerobaculia bacterium]|nr:DNA repair protein RadC [Thermoanaerobaculia bacterium]